MGLLSSHKDDPAYADWNTEADAFDQTVAAALAKT